MESNVRDKVPEGQATTDYDDNVSTLLHELEIHSSPNSSEHLSVSGGHKPNQFSGGTQRRSLGNIIQPYLPRRELSKIPSISIVEHPEMLGDAVQQSALPRAR
jgi:hypothetical protein